MKFLCTLAVILAGVLPAAAQRLPGNVAPLHYDLRIEPDLAAARFAGLETIAVNLRAPATTIVVNAAEIEFGTVQIAAAGRTQTAKVTLEAAKDQATFTVPETIPAGEAQIRIEYAGTLNDDLRGLYLSKANNRRYAVTQLEATDARRMRTRALLLVAGVLMVGAGAIAAQQAGTAPPPRPRPRRPSPRFSWRPGCARRIPKTTRSTG